MKRLSFLLPALVALLTSCVHEEPVYDESMKVGYVLIEDGRMIAPWSVDAAAVPVGVVFAVRHDTAFVVALRDNGKAAYLADTLFSQSAGTGILDLDGEANTALLINEIAEVNASGKSSTAFHVPAAESCWSYKPGITAWYLPSIAEMRMLSESLPRIEPVIRDIGGTGFAREQYLSSTQDGTNEATKITKCYAIDMQNGYVTSVSKQERHFVRPVLKIR
jgi:hypothetical protein